jgi:hypothetical protein
MTKENSANVNSERNKVNQKEAETAMKQSEISIGEQRTFWTRSWVYIAILALLTLIVFNQFFFKEGMLFSSDQLSGLDSRIFLKNSIQEHKQLPFWFSSRLGGMPTLDALFGDLFYIPSIIINNIFPVHRAVSFGMVFHIFLAGCFFFLMLRKGFSLSPLIALTGALFYMFNPEFLSHLYSGHNGKMSVIAWLPFIVWRVKRLCETPSFWNMSWLGLGIGMCILTSHIQLTYFVLWGIFFYYVLASVFAFVKEKNIKRGIRISVFFWLAIIVGLGIGIIQIFPSMMYVREAFSVRGIDRGFEFASSWSLHWPEAFSLIVPEFVNTLDYYWGQNPFKLNSEYAGIIVLFLAVMAVISKPNRWRIFWGAVTLFALLFALGAHTPVFTVAYYIIPGVKKFRACSMMMFWFSFGSIILASLFLKDILKGELALFTDKIKKNWSKGLLIAGSVLFVLTLAFSNKDLMQGLFGSALQNSEKIQLFTYNFSKNFVPFLWLGFFMLIMSVGIVYGLVKGAIKPVYAVVAFLLMGTFDILRIDAQFIKMIDHRPYLYVDPALANLKDKMKIDPFRCFALPGALQNNGEGIAGLEGVSGFHDNEMRWYREFRGDSQDRNYIMSLINFNEQGQAFLNGEKLSVGNAFLNIANARYMLVRSENQLLTIENKNALGRISFAYNYTVMDSAKIMESLNNDAYDYKNTIAFQTEPSVKYSSNPPPTGSLESVISEGQFTSSWKEYSPNIRKVVVNAPVDGYLRLSEVYYPAWEIKIDGKMSEFYRADVAWIGIPVTKGEHTIEIIAHSRYLEKVYIISISLLVILLFYLGLGAFVNRKKSVNG